jgi:hypothetical protein
MFKPTSHKIRSYNRKGFSIQLTEEGRNKILDKKLLKELKSCDYCALPESSGDFVILNGKKVFVKKTSDISDAQQLLDYVEQSKIINNIPKIYGFAKIHAQNKVYVVSKLIPDAIPLTDVIKSGNKELNLRLRKEIEEIGTKLISKNQLPWDFLIRQFFFSKKSNKLYFSDNSINFNRPDRLAEVYRKCGLNVPMKLRFLELALTKHPVIIMQKATRRALKVKEGEKLAKAIPNKPRLLSIKDKLLERYLKDMKVVFKETNRFYREMNEETKRKIQRRILSDLLNSFDSISNNI